MNTTSFEDRVTDLCSRALTSRDDDEVKQLVTELRQVLHERIEELRRRLAFSSGASALTFDRSRTNEMGRDRKG